MLGLSVVAAACAKKVVVQIKPGYREPVNIYTVTTLPSGSRKTAVFADVTAPMEEYERSEAKRTAGEIAKARTAYKIREARLRRLQEHAANPEEKGRDRFAGEAEALAEELARTPIPVPLKCIADDCTPEKIPALLEARRQYARVSVGNHIAAAATLLSTPGKYPKVPGCRPEILHDQTDPFKPAQKSLCHRRFDFWTTSLGGPTYWVRLGQRASQERHMKMAGTSECSRAYQFEKNAAEFLGFQGQQGFRIGERLRQVRHIDDQHPTPPQASTWAPSSLYGKHFVVSSSKQPSQRLATARAKARVVPFPMWSPGVRAESRL
jgi:hypothetical protein